MQDFITFYADAAEKLKAANAENDSETTGRLTHNLAGLAGAFGANTLMTVCRDAERTILQGHQLNADQLQAFADSLEEFLTAIDQYSTGRNQANLG